jgi:hypothetical protein
MVDSYNRMFPLLFRKFPGLFHPDVHTPDAWLWAQAMVCTNLIQYLVIQYLVIQ